MLPSLGNGDPLKVRRLQQFFRMRFITFLVEVIVSVSPSEGTVAPGTQIDLEVTFDAQIGCWCLQCFG